MDAIESFEAEQNDAPLLEVADGAAADIGLGHFAHFDGAHDASGKRDVLQGRLKEEGNDHGGDHADGIADDAVDVGCLGAAKNVAAADDDSDFDPDFRNPFDLIGQPIEQLVIESEIVLAP